ncbi:hypothetical protein CcI156_13090 [Frankia sp. CcI156]|jgi:hypothetical protein|uniref:Uncharacterized protein n=1 Tax=Frankia casuarinae (strain DSM 45818 / CECT 9043 / HFP020203 / CcI3) TaxID=106370 RepID=Q2J9S2_FRACC|nr:MULTISPECIES: hypothetical protein [Frankia]ABD11970.1 hypothetical protein Francci3_2608 [Frankia casuarinae]ETA01890.1 hypothetical protein CcI6DRAFT_02738 [Frankia sp. CcI6]EYT92500.1 hypothetical protein ThrDRAFT_01783 [Frankia casuarinae]KDA43014.1 hypothetical protein BMG523Draft_02069 [Frankia sp. BMG5.23]KEZ36499.1 hypothetical protein CEDDRAFT_02187 [Frankia sp. CeD]
MLWALLYLVLIVGALALLALSAWRVWQKMRAVRAVTTELSARVSVLASDTAALAARLDHAEVSARLAERTS